MPAPPQPPVPVSALSERSLLAHQQQLRRAEGRAGGQPTSAGSKRDPAQTDGRVSTSAPTYTLPLDAAAAAASPSHLAAALRTVAAATAKGSKAAQGAQVGEGRLHGVVLRGDPAYMLALDAAAATARPTLLHQ